MSRPPRALDVSQLSWESCVSGQTYSWPVSDEISDGDLVAAARAGDRSAWDVLVRRHSPRLWAIARVQGLDRDSASDVVQIGWLELLKSMDRLDQPDSVGAWLNTTVRREAVRTCKRLRRDVEPSETLPSDLPPPDERLLSRERAAALRSAFVKLDEPCRELLWMLAADPAPSYREIAEMTNRAIGGIGPTRGRCLETLREMLAAEPLFRTDEASRIEGSSP
jgi:RNA polymerase sigma factor (sigma-70 family)